MRRVRRGGARGALGGGADHRGLVLAELFPGLVLADLGRAPAAGADPEPAALPGDRAHVTAVGLLHGPADLRAGQVRHHQLAGVAMKLDALAADLELQCVRRRTGRGCAPLRSRPSVPARRSVLRSAAPAPLTGAAAATARATTALAARRTATTATGHRRLHHDRHHARRPAHRPRRSPAHRREPPAPPRALAGAPPRPPPPARSRATTTGTTRTLAATATTGTTSALATGTTTGHAAHRRRRRAAGRATTSVTAVARPPDRQPLAGRDRWPRPRRWAPAGSLTETTTRRA